MNERQQVLGMLARGERVDAATVPSKALGARVWVCRIRIEELDEMRVVRMRAGAAVAAAADAYEYNTGMPFPENARRDLRAGYWTDGESQATLRPFTLEEFLATDWTD